MANPGAMAASRAVLSIDAERFDQIPAYRRAAGSAPDADRGPEQVDRLRDLLRAADATATWFVVGEFAREHPDVIERVAADGHEIASHTQTHRHLSALSPADRRSELERSRATLRSITGQSVDGFRAPSFDRAPDHFASVATAGYGYDSSIAPCRSIPGWYGGDVRTRRPVPATAIDPDAPADLPTLPVAVMPGLGLPLTGTWLRLFGVHYTRVGMRLLARQGIAPVLYIHPWELADLPAVEGVPRRVYVRTGEWLWRALERLLDTDFSFVSARSLLAADGLIDG